jgi:hypothetical protein
LGIVFLSMYKACSKRRILHVPNAFKTIDNQLKCLIIHCFECFRRMQNATFRTGFIFDILLKIKHVIEITIFHAWNIEINNIEMLNAWFLARALKIADAYMHACMHVNKTFNTYIDCKNLQIRSFFIVLEKNNRITEYLSQIEIGLCIRIWSATHSEIE